MAEQPSGTVTFLFTDIEGSTELLKRLGGEYAGFLRTHRQLLRDAAGAHGGQEMGTEGDAMFFWFPRARQAVRAAADAQRALAAHSWPGDTQVRVDRLRAPVARVGPVARQVGRVPEQRDVRPYSIVLAVSATS
jgi:class 3 adenylate cyclase